MFFSSGLLVVLIKPYLLVKVRQCIRVIIPHHRNSVFWFGFTIDRLSDLSDKMGFFPSYGCVNTIIWMHFTDTNKMHEEKPKWELCKNSMCCFEQIIEATPNKNCSCTATYLPSHKPLK